MPMNLFGGFIANTNSMSKWISWMQWLSPIRYANEALSHTQFDNVEVGRFQPNVPAAFMTYEGFTLGYWNCILALILWMLVWRALSITALRLMIDKVQ